MFENYYVISEDVHRKTCVIIQDHCTPICLGQHPLDFAFNAWIDRIEMRQLYRTKFALNNLLYWWCKNV